MAMIYQVLEMTEPRGRYRMVGASDESAGVYDPCCLCEDHATEEEAQNCAIAKAKLDRIFHRDIESLEHKVARKRAELALAEQQLAEKRRGDGQGRG